MYVFLIEPKGRFSRKISERYEAYIEKGIDFPLRPYYLYRINDDYTLEDIIISEITIFDKTSPWLFRYSNGSENYFEEVISESVALLKRIPSSPLLQFPETNLCIGDILVFFFFLALKDWSGKIIKKTLWGQKEISDMKKIILSFLLQRVKQKTESAKMN